MPKLTLDLQKKVLELSISHSSYAIARILAQEHNLKISPQAIRKFLQSARRERAETTRAIVQEQIARTVPRDLELLERLRETLAAKVFEGGEPDPERWYKAVRELRQTIEARLEVSGAKEEVLPVKLYDFDASGYPDPES